MRELLYKLKKVSQALIPIVTERAAADFEVYVIRW